jgi:hypothetical protein
LRPFWKEDTAREEASSDSSGCWAAVEAVAGDGILWWRKE